jgi:hypothetical protein
MPDIDISILDHCTKRQLKELLALLAAGKARIIAVEIPVAPL